MEDFLQQDELLIGLAFLRQVFEPASEHDLQAAQDFQRLYRGQEQELMKTVLAAATLCMQRYAADTGVSEQAMISTVRDELLNGKISFPGS